MTFSLIKNERTKVILFAAILIIIQGICIKLYIGNILDRVNENYLKQNTMIIGKIEEFQKGLGEEIVPIITQEYFNSNEYTTGEDILNKYSYNQDLNRMFNPIFSGSDIELKGIFIIVSVFLIGLIGGIFLLMNTLYNEVSYLTLRAENIIDNKSTLKRKYDGSLNRFIIQFELMEERIKNSINLLEDEKINLKNVINDISHQLKTPITAISMYSDILEDHSNMDTRDVDEFLRNSKEQIVRMEWLVKTLLKYARLESNVVEYKIEKFLLNNTILESINPLRIKASKKGVDLSFSSLGEVEFAHDRKWLSEAISNIVKNAIEHTNSGGFVKVNLEETPVTYRISVEDNGEGISKKEMKNIFKRFNKGQNAMNPLSIGIGLCISRSIVRSHGGDISVESEVGIGSTFYITFLKNL